MYNDERRRVGTRKIPILSERRGPVEERNEVAERYLF